MLWMYPYYWDDDGFSVGEALIGMVSGGIRTIAAYDPTCFLQFVKNQAGVVSTASLLVFFYVSSQSFSVFGRLLLWCQILVLSN